jgi:CheY-like chemotaxis protein/tetratricopeptide (TPR) repeat protein
MPPARVLVVEDDLHTRRMIALVLTRDRMLRYRRLEVVTAANGLEGLRAFEKQTPQLLITDLLMPEMDGFELIEAVRATRAGRELPILVTSAVVRNAQVLRKLERDFDVEVQLKPFSPRLLADRVRQLLRSSPRHAGDQLPSVPVEARPSAAAPVDQPAPDSHASAGSSLPTPAKPLLTPPAQAAPSSPEDSLSSPPAADSPRSPALAPPSPALASAAPAAAPSAPFAPSPVADAAAPSAALDSPATDEPTRGEIDETSTVAALLLQLARQQRSGSLDLRRQRLRKVVHLLAGYPIFVQSNLRAETLGQLLVKRGGLSSEDHARVVELAQRERVKYGEALVRAGIKTEAEVIAELVEQTRHKLASCLRWPEGSWTFEDDPDVAHKVPNCTVDPLHTVFTGLRDGDVHAVLAKLFAGGIERRLVPLELERHGVVLREVFGSERIDALGQSPTLSEVLADEPATAMAADALVWAGLARFEALPRAEREQRAKRTPPEARTTSASSEGSPSAEAPALEALVERQETPEAVQLEGLRLSGAWAPVAEQQQRQEEDRIARALVEAAYLGLHSKSHYEVLGVIPETDTNGIEVAFKIKRQQFDLSRFRERDIGEAYAHLEEICAALDEANAVLSDPERRQRYDERELPALRAGSVQRSPALQAEELFAEGQRLLAEGDAASAMVSFERAIALDDQPEYRAQEALAYFLAEGPSPEVGAEAMVRVQAALAAAPEQPLGHVVAARISRILGAQDEALEHLREALGHEALDRAAFDLLELTLLERGDLGELEAEYRRAIFRIGSRDRAWSAALWKRLVLLYRDRLDDPESARKACDAAFRLNPSDDELRAVLRQLVDSGGSARVWPQAVLGYRALVRGAPSDVQPVLELAALHWAEGREDAAEVAAQVALWRGAEPSLLDEVVVEHETVEMPVVAGRLDQARWNKLAHPDEDPGLCGLFDVLAPLLEREDPLTAADLGLSEQGDDGDGLSPEFHAALTHACTTLDLPTPRVLTRPELGQDILAAGSTPPLLLVGNGAMQLDHRRELVFRLGRALTLLQPARRLVGWRSPELLRDYLLAALRALVAAPPDLVGPVETERSVALRRLIRADSALLEACEPWVRRLHDSPGPLDFGRWKRGAQHTAERAGLLLCGDFRTAGRVIVEVSPEAEIELADFALSELHAELRAQLGLAG